MALIILRKGVSGPLHLSLTKLRSMTNAKVIDSFEYRVAFLKRVIYMTRWSAIVICSTGWAMEWMLQGVIMSGTTDQFKKVFEKKSNRRTCTLAVGFVVSFLIIYYLIWMLRYVRD